MAEKTKKELHKEHQVDALYEAGLGDKEYLASLNIKNLDVMVAAIEAKNTEVEATKKKLADAPKKSNGDDYSNATTVNDLVKAKKIGVSEQEKKES